LLKADYNARDPKNAAHPEALENLPLSGLPPGLRPRVSGPSERQPQASLQGRLTDCHLQITVHTMKLHKMK
jgi:hypothetical protein